METYWPSLPLPAPVWDGPSPVPGLPGDHLCGPLDHERAGHRQKSTEVPLCGSTPDMAPMVNPWETQGSSPLRCYSGQYGSKIMVDAMWEADQTMKLWYETRVFWMGNAASETVWQRWAFENEAFIWLMLKSEVFGLILYMLMSLLEFVQNPGHGIFMQNDHWGSLFSNPSRASDSSR